MIHWGLVAGLSFSEMRDMPPGMIIDQYIWRRQYDDEMHGVKRED